MKVDDFREERRIIHKHLRLHLQQSTYFSPSLSVTLVSAAVALLNEKIP